MSPTLKDKKDVQEILQGLKGLEPLKELFWTRLGYDRVNAPLSRKGWGETAKNALAEDPVVWAKGGAGGAFHIIYARMASSGLRRADERPVVERLLREHPYALFVFSNDAQTHWHFLNVKYDPNVENRRLFRRITVGPFERLRTATERISLLDLESISPDLFGLSPLAIQQRHDDAFDVEKVQKEFFQTLFAIYEKDVVPDIQKGLKDEKAAREAGLTLVNRLIFLYFIQKKGWLDGNPEYLVQAFGDHRARPRSRSFYSDFLGRLFDALARPKIDRMDDRMYEFRKIPFLNGGLFEPDSLVSSGDLHVTNASFARLFDELLERFNFTITEDTPLDVEVAVDPEMLGKIFEELVTSRHESGAYYTPRPVVSFMCKEALKGYLGGGKAVERFVDEQEASGLTNPEAVLEKLRDLKVCDPACGSGAYLVGMLQELMALRHALFAAHKVDPRTDYNRKLDIIQNNLYGVDIDPTAVSIARLRLWLTLCIEYEAEDGGDPLPLPNLDFKIEQGDSLLASKPVSLELNDAQIGELSRLKAAYLREPYNKSKTRKHIEQLREELAKWVTHDQSKSAESRFDWRLDFGEVVSAPDRPGFDIVLANPPYVRADAQFKHIVGDEERRQEEIAKWKTYRELLKRDGEYETLYEKWDLYIPFLERAWQLLVAGGQMVFIIPDAYNLAKYAAKSHAFFLRNARIERLDFCSEIDLFDAGVNNTIVIFTKTPPAPDWRPRRVRRWGANREEFENHAEDLPTGPQGELESRLFRPDSSASDQTQAGAIPLEQICYISKGMAIHADERQAHLAFKAADLVSEVKDTTHPKRFVEGKDLGKWVPLRIRYLEYGTKRAPALFRRPTFPQLYEAGEKIISMDIAGATPRAVYDSEKLLHNHSAWSLVPWHLLKGVRNRSIQKSAKYQDEVGPGDFQPEVFREELEAISEQFSLKYILGIMNSTFAKDWLARHRRSKMHIYPDDWKRLPIPPASSREQAAVAALVDKCIAARGVNCEQWEREIDGRVAALYGLTPEEKKIIGTRQREEAREAPEEKDGEE